MEKRLEAKFSISFWILSGRCLGSFHLFYMCACLCALSSSTDANWNRAVCQPEKVLFGGHLRSWEDHQLQLLKGFHTAQSCQAACCQSPSCDAFWLLEKMCIQVNCVIPHQCQANRTDSSDSVLVFLKKSKTTEHSLSSQSEGEVETLLHKLLDWHMPVQAKKRLRRSFWELLTQKQHLANDRRGLLKRDKTDIPTRGNAENLPSGTLDSKSKSSLSKIDLKDNPESRPSLREVYVPSDHATREKTSLQNGADSREQKNKSLAFPESNSVSGLSDPTGSSSLWAHAGTSTSELPVLATFSSPIALGLTATGKAEKPKQSNDTSIQPLSLEEILPTISALQGKNTMKVQTVTTLPTGVPTNDSVTTVQAISAMSSSTPTPVPVMKELVVSAGNNVQVTLPKNEVQLNAFVLPEPPTESTDDDKIVSFHWEELKGPLREEKVSTDTAILKLTNLVPGNYTFSLTVEDSDGASNSTTASLTVNKEVDYPPVANAGPNQVITLPQNSITLYGNQSTDDHSIVSYEWLLSPNSKGKVMEMQGVRTPILQLSAMQEGDYTYQLTVTDSAGHQSTAEVTVIVQPENNKPPKADAGPDKELTLPVDSTTLDGSKSSDDQKIVSFLWEKTRGPDGVKLENVNSSIATVTGLQVGTYEFTLTVKDERSLQSESSVNVIVKEEMNKPPVAKIAGNVVITLPTNTAALDGSKSWDDKGIVSYLWTRDEGSPAAGEVLNNSDHHPVLFLSNLVEGTYTFHLKVTDAKGESDADRTTVEVKADPRKNNLVEMILDVNVSQLTERQKGMLIRQIGVLLGVLDSDITVQKIQPYTEQSTKMVFFVQNQPPHQIFKGHHVAWTLKSELRKQQSDFLIFRALEINTVTCQLNCSEHGRCDSFTKRCICDPFWMENFIKVQMGEGESNCEWSVLYVIIASFVIVVAFGILSWTVVCCCKRRKGKPKRKSKYKILDATDQESLELKPNLKAGSRQKAQVLNTSLMHSESELDSDEAIFTWPDREKGKLLRSQNGSLRNGQVLPKPKNQREEIL
nr:dyslexia-associated protein KIAA0319-like protein homolog isoform X2 [Caretta caretta]